jgi:pimeloyl-ACP methyl ester carboxylesterase
VTEHAPSSTGFAAVNGVQIYYEIAGSGHPLVLVHAGIADLRMWDAQFPVFAQHYRTLRYDMRGFGRTAMLAGPFTHYDDLHGLLTFLGVERAYLLGCSKGGSTIIDFALEHPEMAGALITVGSSPGGTEFTGSPPKQWDELTAAFDSGDLARTSELEVQIWVDGRTRTPDQVDPAIRDLVREMNMVPLATEAANLGSEQRLEPPALNRLDDISAPMLVIVGDLDDPNIGAAADMMTQRIAGAQQAIISGTAHLPNMERPAEFNRLVLDFLAGIGE